MNTQHPITPPPELVTMWVLALEGHTDSEVFTQAARWGADQELEACEKWLKANEWIHSEFNDDLRAARRPKPPSLKQQALEVLDDASSRLDAAHENIIRRALELLDD